MAGNKEAGSKMRQTMIDRFGSEEAWKDWLRENGRKNKGKSKPNSGFAHPDARPSYYGRIGGKIRRRGKKQ